MTMTPEIYELLKKAVAAQEAEEKLLASMTPEQQKKYIDDWAERLAKDVANLND